MPTPDTKPLAQVLQEHADALLQVNGVVGVAEGQSRGKPCILILVASLTPQLRQSLPKSLDGYKVKVQETGELRARK